MPTRRESKWPYGRSRVRSQSARAAICRRPVTVSSANGALSSFPYGGFSSSSCTPCVGSTVAAAALSPSKKFPGATANVFDAVEHVVTWGLEHRTLGQIDAIGVDEIQYSKGHKYLTLVYQIDLGVTRLLWIGKEGTIESFQGFFTTMGEEITSKIVFICSDMWVPMLRDAGLKKRCSRPFTLVSRLHARIAFPGADAGVERR